MALQLYAGTVTAEWVDELDHMNFLEYQRIADLASGRFLQQLSDSPDAEWTPGTGLDAVIIETRVRYLRELRLGAEVTVSTTLAAFDERRCHLLHQVGSNGRTVCAVEVLLLAFDLESRRASHWPAPGLQRLSQHACSDPPPAEARLMAWIERSWPPGP